MAGGVSRARFGASPVVFTPAVGVRQPIPTVGFFYAPAIHKVEAFFAEALGIVAVSLWPSLTRRVTRVGGA